MTARRSIAWALKALVGLTITAFLIACHPSPTASEEAHFNPWLEVIDQSSGLVVVNHRPLPEPTFDQWLTMVMSLADPSIGGPAKAQTLLSSLHSSAAWRSAGLDPQGFFALYQQHGHLIWQVPVDDSHKTEQWLADMAIGRLSSHRGEGSQYSLHDDWIGLALTNENLTVAVGPEPFQTLERLNTNPPSPTTQSWTNAGWQEFNQTHELDGHVSGYIDTRDWLTQNAMISEVCLADWQASVAPLNRLVFGTHQVHPHHSTWRAKIELDGIQWPPIDQSSLPDIDLSWVQQAQVAGIGLRFDLPTTRQAIVDLELSQRPHQGQCPSSQILAQQKRVVRALANRPIPPLLTSLFGVASRFDGLIDNEPSGAQYVTEVYLRNPQFLIGLAQMFSPDLAAINFASQQTPVPLPEPLTQALGGTPIYLATTDTSITASSDPNMMLLNAPLKDVPPQWPSTSWLTGMINFERIDELEAALRVLPMTMLDPKLITPLSQWAHDAQVSSLQWRIGQHHTSIGLWAQLAHRPNSETVE